MKAQVFGSTGAADGARPILVAVLHGDLPDPDYHYVFARSLTQAPSDTDTGAAVDEPIVAAGILRPGYRDPSGDRSSGTMGRATADNYTPEVIDSIAVAARLLEADFDARAVVLVGHSGGAAIVADVLGRHPDVADAALLVGCGCDPEAWRNRMRSTLPSPIWDEPNASLMPLALVGGLNRDVKVRMLVGDQDADTPPQDSRRYANALVARGIDVQLTVAPGLAHNILLTPETRREFRLLLDELP